MCGSQAGPQILENDLFLWFPRYGHFSFYGSVFIFIVSKTKISVFLSCNTSNQLASCILIWYSYFRV